MLQELIRSIRILLLMTVLCGAVYPLGVHAVAQSLMSDQANGSLVLVGDRVIGSQLIGQLFSDPMYMWSRPSATPPAYNGGASSGSNLGPTNPALTDAVRDRIAALRAADPSATGPVPIDLITASGSGLDPHISPAAALYQATRIAAVRAIPVATVEAVIGTCTEGRGLGILGEPRVNVLCVNLDLDGLGQ